MDQGLFLLNNYSYCVCVVGCCGDYVSISTLRCVKKPVEIFFFDTLGLQVCDSLTGNNK